MIKLQKISLKKQVKLMEYFQTKVKKKIMIILDMRLLKMEAVDKVVVSEGLVVQIFQIFLKIFLEILVVAEEVVEEVLITEALI